MAFRSIPQVKFNMLHPLLVKVGATNVVASAIAVIISATVASAFVVLSILMGSVIGAINLSLLARTVKSGFLFKPDNAQRFIMKRYYIKLIATMFIVGILVSQNLAHPVGLIIGFTIIMINTLTSAIYFSTKEAA